MSFSIGIVGLPNVGKSTLFRALTQKQVDIANYPFCTIDPNVGVVAVPDERLEKLAVLSKSARIVPTTVEFVDIAGLVRGAHRGEGLGNQFLSHIREVDAICMVLRWFADGDIIHVENTVDPLRDRDIVEMEMIMADMQVVRKRLESISKQVKGGDKEAMRFSKLLEKVLAVLNAGKPAHDVSVDEAECVFLNSLQLLTAKPLLYVVNVAENDNVSLPSELAALTPVRLCAKLEAELVELPQDEVRVYFRDAGFAQTGLDQLIVRVYELLGLRTYLTTGEKETRAWTVKAGTLAPQAAGVIHTDFEKGFVKAEVVQWKALVEAESYAAARQKGKLRIEGKEYVIQDGDVIIFKIAP